MDVKKITEEIIKNATIQGEAEYSGDYKKGNKASNKLFSIWKEIKNDLMIAREIVDVLKNHENVNVRIWICSISLDINYKVDETKLILEKISKDSSVGILALNAEMTLKMWLKHGYLLKNYDSRWSN